MSMKINLRTIYIVIASVFVFGCTKEEFVPKNYPITKTLPFADYTYEGLTFRGEIAYSTVEIIDHGFIWSETGDPREVGSQSVSFGPRSGVGVFETRRDWGFKPNKTYYVRAYAKTADQTVYGNRIGFSCDGCKRPSIKSFFPMEGTWNDTITIVGENFSEQNEHNIVKFGQFRGTVIYSSRDTVRVKVPMEVTELWSSITLTFEENSAPAMNHFTLKGPIIESVTPNEAAVGTTVVIKGKYLMSVVNEVTFGGRRASLTSRSPDTIECVVPDVPSGTVTLQLVTGTYLVTTAYFKVLP